MWIAHWKVLTGERGPTVPGSGVENDERFLRLGGILIPAKYKPGRRLPTVPSRLPRPGFHCPSCLPYSSGRPRGRKRVREPRAARVVSTASR